MKAILQNSQIILFECFLLSTENCDSTKNIDNNEADDFHKGAPDMGFASLRSMTFLNSLQFNLA